MKRIPLLLLTLLFLPSIAHAQITGSSGNGSVDWLYSFTNNLTDLTTQNQQALSEAGMFELATISFFVLIGMSINWSTMAMTFRMHVEPLRVGDLNMFLLRLIICCLLENYWVNPLPGATFGLNHFFSYIAQVIVAAIDQQSLTNLQNLFATAGQNTPLPAVFAVPQWILYFIIQICIGLDSAILFLINVSSFIFYAVVALFGPIFIPLYMSATFRHKFMHFVDILLSFAMIRAVAAAFIYVWSGFLTGFVQKTFNGDYSLANWLANLIPVFMVQFAFILNMISIPSVTQIVFGGGAGIAGRIGSVAEYLVARRVMA